MKYGVGRKEIDLFTIWFHGKISNLLYCLHFSDWPMEQVVVVAMATPPWCGWWELHWILLHQLLPKKWIWCWNLKLQLMLLMKPDHPTMVVHYQEKSRYVFKEKPFSSKIHFRWAKGIFPSNHTWKNYRKIYWHLLFLIFYRDHHPQQLQVKEVEKVVHPQKPLNPKLWKNSWKDNGNRAVNFLWNKPVILTVS